MDRTVHLANSIVLTLMPIWMGTATFAAVTGESTLNRLEERLLGHACVHDTENERVARLERFVYGEASTGSMDARVSRLASSVIDSHAAKDRTIAAQSDKINGGRKCGTNLIKTVEPGRPVTKAVNYPRINRLELTMLGNTYASDPLKTRLARLEQKAFGTAASSNDLSARVDKLNSYAGVFDITRAQLSPNDLPTLLRTSSSVDGQQKGTINQRLTLLEMVIFGKTSTQESLTTRIKRLEDTLVPSEENTSKLGLAERVTRMLAIVQEESLSSIEEANRRPGTPDLIRPAVATKSASQSSAGGRVAVQNVQNSGQASIFKKIAHGLGKGFGG
jgi:hypothetical protein